jgi:short-subunit dehydrogenase
MALPPPAEGSTALVTGASSGIGEQFARQLAQRGHGVTLVARRVERLEALAQELRETQRVTVHVVAADLADPAARDALEAELGRRELTVEILINNAGFGIYRDFARSARDRELEQVRVNVEAVVDLAARFYPPMVERGRGAIINMSSTAGLQPIPGNGTYAASKAFVLTFSESLYAEAEDAGVTVTAVLPGPVATEFQEVSDAVFAEKLPRLVWASAEQVARDGLRAADRGRRSVIPRRTARLAFAPNRFAPKWLALAVGKRLMAR